MSLALYRKYRPGSFAEVKGQEHVTGPLRQALTNGRIHHAYLLSGPRGCGKTSSARILARSLNCAQGPTADPCGVCDSCVALAPNGPGSLDVIELDAASHGGVDDARDLRDKAIYAPVSSRFKVYIIDEAHMVTKDAFNALLKLVEEPPDFVKFVFATTEPDKVLPTIRSRTHHYPFRLMPRRELTALLQEVVGQEGVAVDPLVLPLVVRAAAGSARDALSILDQVLASAGEEGVTREGAAGLLGVTPDVLLDDLLDAFCVSDAAAVFRTVDQVMEGGHDPRRFAADVLERLRDLVIYDAVPDAAVKGVLDCPPEQLDRMSRQAASLGTAGLSRAADLFHAGLTEMRGATAPRLLLELVCARVLLPSSSTDPAAVLSRVERLELRFDIGAPAAPPVTPPHVERVHDEPPLRAAGPAGGAQPAGDPEPAGDAPARSQTRRDGQPARDGRPARNDEPVRDDRPVRDEQPVRDDQAARSSQPDQGAPAVRPKAPERDGAGQNGSAGAPAARPAAADSGWPTAATPGGAGAQVAPAAEPAPAPTSGSIDAAAVRRVWDTVLERVKEEKRVTHALVRETQVARVEGGRLYLSFETPTLAKHFHQGVHVDVLRAALLRVLGVELEVVGVAGPDHRPPASSPPPSPPPTGSPRRPSPAARVDGFAPGDEPADEEDGVPPPVERGEEAALRLVEQALGGRVVGTIGD